METTKEEFKQALDERRVIVTTAKETKNGITGYNVYIYKPEVKYYQYIFLHGMGPYWSEKKGYYHIVAWGTSRINEIILSIGYHLGLKFHEINQNGIVKL